MTVHKSLGTEINPEYVDVLYSPSTPWKKINENVVQLPKEYSFDLEKARYEYKLITDKFNLAPFEYTKNDVTLARRSYRGLGLTHKPESQNKLYDALSLYTRDKKINIYDTFKMSSEKIEGKNRDFPLLDESGFSEKTDACSPFFSEIIDRFKSTYTKVRFLSLSPGGLIPPHIDFPYYQGIRVHASIFTNPDVVWEIDGKQFQIPADGNFYWFDTGKYHAVKNYGNEDRVVFSVNLMVYFDRSGAQQYAPSNDLIDLINAAKI